MKENFIPEPAVIREIITQNGQIRTFRLELQDKTKAFTFLPGQFLMLSLPHCGEAAISISSSPTALPLIDLSIRKAGKLTAAIHEMKPGAQVGIRGPFGKPFPVNSFSGRDLLFVGPTKTFDIVADISAALAASEKSFFKPTEPMKGKPRPEGRKGRVQACRSWNPVL